MKRRTFIALGLVTGVGAILAGAYGKSGIRRLYRTVYKWFLPAFQVASGNESVSVEMVLNSRCTSDWDGDPHKFHWGIFDPGKKLSEDIVERIITLSRVPRLTDRGTRIREDSATLSFRVPNEPDDTLRSLLMIESGMQQQSVGLSCAALGVGMVFDNRGRDGALISDTEIETTRIKLAPMQPGYKGSFWTTGFPGNRSPWLPGNLVDPIRNGDSPFLSVLPGLEIQRKTCRSATEVSLSQLLWAARGRTPHFFKSKPWGMTIPTWRGEQNISSLYVIRNREVLRYINWIENRPTHMLANMGDMNASLCNDLAKSLDTKNGLIVIGINEKTNRALWEVGYQLFNLLVQASGLGISFKAFLLEDAQRKTMAEAGIRQPVVAFAHF